MVLIHPKVLHGGGMNRSARPRRNIILQAGDADGALREMPAREVVAGRRLGGRRTPGADRREGPAG